jgi:pimeloyl-ACP methyl ester carboxylesterase
MTYTRRSVHFHSFLLMMIATVGGLSPNSFSQEIKLTPAQRARAHGQLPLTVFYDTPSPLPVGKPGDLIRSQPFDEYALPDGVAAIRILYHSRSADGLDVASSGVVLLPPGSAPKDGWPIVAWAHASTAVARQCAPSLMRNMGSGSVLSMYANLGYAVVATDYTGLGTAFRNAAFDAPSNATDVTNAVLAARKAMPQLGAKWIVVGEGTGGTAALSATELDNANSGLLGAMSISGVLDLKSTVDHAVETGFWQDSLGYLAYSIATVNPAFAPGNMLTTWGMSEYARLSATCASSPSHASSPIGKALKPGWQDEKSVRDYLIRNTLGVRSGHVPMLIISSQPASGSSDAIVVARMCRQDDHVDFVTYPGVEPNELIGTTVATQLDWIKARFQGRTTRNTCH